MINRYFYCLAFGTQAHYCARQARALPLGYGPHLTSLILKKEMSCPLSTVRGEMGGESRPELPFPVFWAQRPLVTNTGNSSPTKAEAGALLKLY